MCCSKNSTEVQVLIALPITGFICDECVVLCYDIVVELKVDVDRSRIVSRSQELSPSEIVRRGFARYQELMGRQVS